MTAEDQAKKEVWQLMSTARGRRYKTRSHASAQRGDCSSHVALGFFANMGDYLNS